MDAVLAELKKIGGMVVGLLHSRKFYALAASLVTIGSSYASGKITPDAALIAVIGALAAYMIGTGLDDSGPATPPAALK